MFKERIRRRALAFTLIELMVVMAIVGLLLTLVMPRYFHSVERGREAVLRHDLKVMREAIDQHLTDRGRYPSSLQELADLRYLRSVPEDPVTGNRDWLEVPAPLERGGTGIHDVRSGAAGNSLLGVPYDSL